MSVEHPILVQRAPGELRPSPRNARTHSKKQIRQIADSIKRFGFTNPVLIDDAGFIIAGHGRVEAAKQAGLETIPTLDLSRLTPAERRAYLLADNQLATKAGWDADLLRLEIQELSLEFDLDLIGFETREIEIISQGDRATPVPRAKRQGRKASSADARAHPESDLALTPDDAPVAWEDVPVTMNGDLWQLGEHRLICGNPAIAGLHERLLGGEAPAMLFTSWPDRDGCGVPGEIGSRLDGLKQALKYCKVGALVYVGGTWSDMATISAVAEIGVHLKDVCVWTSTTSGARQAGAGSVYPDQRRPIFVLVRGLARRNSEIQRSGVWDYPTACGWRDCEGAEIADLQPAALVADALMDGSGIGDIVIDPFGALGTTLVAAERTGRRARLAEADRHCCDLIIRRFEKLTRVSAFLVTSGETFQQASVRRRAGEQRP